MTPETFCAHLLYMDIVGSILAAGVMLFRKQMSRRIPPTVFVILWDVVLARLLLPVSSPPPSGVTAPWVFAYPQFSAVPAGFSAAVVLIFVWAAGAAGAFLYMALVCRNELSMVRDALPLAAEDEKRIEALGIRPGSARILVSDRFTAPVTAGVFRHRIILPTDFRQWDDGSLRFVLLHELAHVSRRDVLQKLAVSAAACVHWFNPLIWLLKRSMDRDLERACDENVIRRAGETTRSSYARILLNFAAERAECGTLRSGFSESAVHERIVSVLHNKKTSAAGITAAVLAVICSAAVFAVPGPVGERVVQYVYDADTGRLYEGSRLIAVLDTQNGQDVYMVEDTGGTERITITVGPVSMYTASMAAAGTYVFSE